MLSIKGRVERKAVFKQFIILYGPNHVKTCLRTYANDGGPDLGLRRSHMSEDTFSLSAQTHWIIQDQSMTGDQIPG